MAAIPQILRNFNLFLNGSSFAGLIDEVKLPDFKIKEEEHKGGGLDAPVAIDMGMEKLEASFTAAEHIGRVISAFGLNDGRGTQLTFRGAMVADAAVKGYVVDMRGAIRGMDLGTVKANEKAPFSATVAIRYIQISQGGVELLCIDVDNMIRRVNGVDRLTAIRNAIS